MSSHSIYQTPHITLQWLFGCVLALLLNGCTASIEDYEQAEPKFDLFQFFEGHSQAWGMVQDYKGQQVRRFDVKLNGVITGNQLVLKILCLMINKPNNGYGLSSSKPMVIILVRLMMLSVRPSVMKKAMHYNGSMYWRWILMVRHTILILKIGCSINKMISYLMSQK